MSKKRLMTPKSASRIQSISARKNGGVIFKNSFAARAQAAAAKNYCLCTKSTKKIK